MGYFIDSYGFRKAVLVGTWLMAIFGLLRAFSPNFTFLLTFQTLAAFGQPFIMNSISKLVKGWFPEKESGLATGLGLRSHPAFFDVYLYEMDHRREYEKSKKENKKTKNYYLLRLAQKRLRTYVLVSSLHSTRGSILAWFRPA